MLHAVNHSLTKACLFLVAGNVLAAYRTKSALEVRGMMRLIPWSGVLWIAGFLAITGSPPFGVFLSEMVILKAALDGGHPCVAAIYLALLTTIFIGMSAIVLRMAQPGDESAAAPPRAEKSEATSAVLPPLALAAVVLMLGIYVPPALRHLLARAGDSLGLLP
jgi:hydrogenase-4 component F